MSHRTLIAGFGNELRGDDGFGVEVIRRLGARAPVAGVKLMEVGTAGLRLAQELLSPCDRLIVVDAMRRGSAPGTLYVERVESVEPVADVDMHLAVPARALGLARALGALPPEVFIVGCEPAEVDELTTALTPAVAAAVEAALARIDALLGAPGTTTTPGARASTVAGAQAAAAAPGVDPVAALEQRDEVLQIMFWLRGEGLGPDVAPADVLRFVDDETAVHATLRQLADDGLAERLTDADGAPRYRLTAEGVREGGRRFMDEFEPYLARSAHGGECGVANCECHRGGSCQQA